MIRRILLYQEDNKQTSWFLTFYNWMQNLEVNKQMNKQFKMPFVLCFL